jgi:hypothetical protein
VNSGEFDYVNVHWYFVNDLNWPAIEAASRRDMGVFIISPNDKGGKLYDPPPKLVELCAPLTPMQFNDLYCLARPQVHTLSCGAARPGDFDEHICALAHYDRIAATMAPVEKSACARNSIRVLGAGLVRTLAGGAPVLPRGAGAGQPGGNPPSLDLREGARPRGVGQDALQPAGAW